MLPSKRFFVCFSCPFFEDGACGRPHCHFRHVRPKVEQPGPRPPDVPSSASYRPTPISELKQRHIPVLSAPSRPRSSRIIPYDPKHPSSSTPAYSRNLGERSNDSGDELELLHSLEPRTKKQILDSILEKEFENKTEEKVNGHQPTPEELLASLEGSPGEKRLAVEEIKKEEIKIKKEETSRRHSSSQKKDSSHKSSSSRSSHSRRHRSRSRSRREKNDQGREKRHERSKEEKSVSIQEDKTAREERKRSEKKSCKSERRHGKRKETGSGESDGEHKRGRSSTKEDKRQTDQKKSHDRGRSRKHEKSGSDDSERDRRKHEKKKREIEERKSCEKGKERAMSESDGGGKRNSRRQEDSVEEEDEVQEVRIKEEVESDVESEGIQSGTEAVLVTSSSSSSEEEGYAGQQIVNRRERVAHPGATERRLPEPQSKQPSLQQSLADRWLKARQSLQAGVAPQGARPRIGAVPNVHSLLSERKVLLQAAAQAKPKPLPRPQAPPPSKQVEEDYVPPSKVRRAHLPSGPSPGLTTSHCPVLTLQEDTKVPAMIRQNRLTLLFEEYAKFLGAEVASARAVEAERDIHSRIKCTKTYQSAVTVAILRIRKTRGQDREEVEKPLCGEAVPEWTFGLSLYECFSKYLLTEEQLQTNGYPLELLGHEGCAYIHPSTFNPKRTTVIDENLRQCVNCARTYPVDDLGVPLGENDCSYHWGKTYRKKIAGSLATRYLCCGADLGSDQCTTARYHVANTFDERCLEGYVKTRPNSGDPGIYGLDCEMCHTTLGLEITRCSVVDLNGKVVYDSKIKPDAQILDYCTRFSGIKEEDLADVTKRLPQVQLELLRFISDRTILVGHSLESDLRALRIVHSTVVDTAIVFPHKNGPVIKRALRNLARELLSAIIQDQDSGHCSAEDARTCIQLMLNKVKTDCMSRKPRQIVSVSRK